MSKNTGIPYERLAQRVFQEIVSASLPEGMSSIVVQHDVVLKGVSTDHQIDVLWEFEISGIRYRTVVQCKDHGKPVKQGDMLAFAQVLADLPGQPRGVFVARSGFQKGATRIAQSKGISLYELREPTDDDWDGYIKTIVLTLRLYVPRSVLSNVELDKEWNDAEKKRLGIPPNEVIQVPIGRDATEVIFMDGEGRRAASVADVFEGRLRTVGTGKLPPTPVRHEFEPPVFLPTSDARFPKAAVRALEGQISVSELVQEIRIDGTTIVGVILKDVLGGKEVVFDKNLKTLPRSPTGT